MKIFKFLAMIAIAIMSVFTLSSCGDDDKDEPKKVSIVGTWECKQKRATGSTVTYTLIFNSDHTGVVKEDRMTVDEPETRSSSYAHYEMAFNWATTSDSNGNDIMRISYVSGDKNTDIFFDEDEDQRTVLWSRIYILTGDILNISDGYGSVWVFNRK